MPFDFDGKVTIEHSEPYKVELTRGQKGTYGWTITVHTQTAEGAADQLTKLDAELQNRFPTNGNANGA